MIPINTFSNLKGPQLALWAYLREYGIDKVIHADDIYSRFPFAKHLFRNETDLCDILKPLAQIGLLTVQEENRNKYKRAREKDSNEVWSIIFDRLIDTDRSFVRDRMTEIIRDISLYDFLELAESLSDKNFKDPFLIPFSRDPRLGREEWWNAVCHLAHLYDRVTEDNISDLFLKFVEVAGLKLSKSDDQDTFAKKIDKEWKKNKLIELEAVVDNITPWKAQMKIQFILVQWRDISIAKRDQMRNCALESLLRDATLANAILPVGNPNERDEETLKSTQLVIFTPQDNKSIFINKDPKNQFKTLLRERMDIELLSPYQTTGFVPETMFFGRQEQLRQIAAHPETNYAIYGSRKNGKTSLIKQLERVYKGKQPVAFIDNQMVSNEQDFFTLLSNALHIKVARSSADFEDVAKDINPGTLLLIDEIDSALETCGSSHILNVLRHLVGQYGARCILAGTTELYKQYLDRKSPMYNFADPLPLGPLTELEAINLAKEPMLNIGVAYQTDGIIKQLINNCGRFPNLIQLMCNKLIKEVKQEGTGRVITFKMLKKVFEGEDFGGDVYKQFYHNFNAIQKLIIYTSLMVKEMSLQAMVKKVREHYNLSLTQIEKELDELVFLFVLKKTGTTYKWLYKEFPVILKRQIGKDINFRIEQTIMEIEGKTQ